jgi:aldehyde:ferredoxin oxidoreductase
MSDKITIKINDKEIAVRPGTKLLAAIREAGERVPTLCQHKDLTPGGKCRLCTCEVTANGTTRMATACNLVVKEPLTVQTETAEVVKHRKLLAEMYLGRWPEVRAVKAIAGRMGVVTSRFTAAPQDEAANACILCGRCVSACHEFVLERVLQFAGRGPGRHITMPFGDVDPHCIGCTSCAYVCPTGAIEVVDDLNHPLNPTMIRNSGMKVNAEMATLDAEQCRMREVGTANIVDVMNAYDLLPVMNYKYGSHPDAHKVDSKVLKSKYFTQGQADGCWPGCSMACAKAVDGFELKTGPYKGEKVTVDGPEYETAGGCTNMGCFDPDFVVEFNFYCDTYGVDTISVATSAAFAMEAFEAGQITTEHTGGLELCFGAGDVVLELLHQMARGEGFGVELGQGVLRMKEKWVKEYGADAQFLQDIGMEAKGLEYSEYVSKESLAQQCGYTMAIKGPQHDEAWLIFMDMVNNQIPTFEDKAQALYYYPLFRTWFGLMGLCKLCWNDVVPAKNHAEDEPAKVPAHVRGYWKFFEGMTGIEIDEPKMLEQSERVYQLQRVMSYMLGKGTSKFDMPPYRAVGPVTVEEFESRADRYDKQLKELAEVDPTGMSSVEKVAALRDYRMGQYRHAMQVVYEARGWTSDGVPTIERLRRLGIDRPEIVSIIEGAQES